MQKQKQKQNQRRAAMQAIRLHGGEIPGTFVDGLSGFSHFGRKIAGFDEFLWT